MNTKKYPVISLCLMVKPHLQTSANDGHKIGITEFDGHMATDSVRSVGTHIAIVKLTSCTYLCILL